VISYSSADGIPVKLTADDIWGRSSDDGWPYAIMQNTDMGLAPLVNCPVHPGGTYGTAQNSARPRSGASRDGLTVWVLRGGPGRVLGQVHTEKQVYDFLLLTISATLSCLQLFF